VGAVGGFQLAVSSYSRVAQAAIEWVRYETSPEMQIYRAVAASLVPTIPAVAARADVQQAEPLLAALQDVARVTRPSAIFGAKYNQASTVIYRGINQILNGQDVGPVLSDVQRQLEQLLA
jgi:trehalose/maltose transport system substrate-binding protein